MTRSSPSPAPPQILSIAGSDSGGGAGLQADLKTFCAHGAYGMTVVTAVTAQNTRVVTEIHPIPAHVVAAQIDAVMSDIRVDAIKIGMLANASIVIAVAERLAHFRAKGTVPPIVLDPVMIAKSGDSLLSDEAIGVLSDQLLPLATVVTPNLPEAVVLSGGVDRTGDQRLALVRALASALSRFSAGVGASVLLKGGHAKDLDGQPSLEIEDILCDSSGERVFVHPRIATASTHGTGCTLSSAIAARLGRGDTVPESVAGAIEYLQGALAAAYPVGETDESGIRGHGPVNHLFRHSATSE